MAEGGEKRSPTAHRTPGQTKRLDRTYNARPENVKKRVMNNAARAEMVKAGKAHKGDDKDVDHKKPLRSGGGNSRDNLRVISRSKNRGWRDGV